MTYSRDDSLADFHSFDGGERTEDVTGRRTERIRMQICETVSEDTLEFEETIRRFAQFDIDFRACED